MSVLEQRCSDLQENNIEIKKQLRDCHVLLIAENLDPGNFVFVLMNYKHDVYVANMHHYPPNYYSVLSLVTSLVKFIKVHTLKVSHFTIRNQ